MIKRITNMQSTKTTKTQNEVLNTSIDIDFAMDQETAKTVEKKAAAKTEKKGRIKKDCSKKEREESSSTKRRKAC